MRSVIRADLRRILRKPTFYILIVIALVLLAFRKPAETASDQIESVKTFMNGVALFAVSIPTFLGVYSDDFKCGSMINLIGKGLSRKKVIIAKILDVAIILTAFYTCAYIVAFIKNMASGLSVTPKQNMYLLLFFLFCVLRGIGLFVLASFVVFSTWSAPGGMTVLVVLIILAKLVLKGIQDKITVPVFDMSYDGLLDASYAGFQAGNFGWQIIPAILIYICGIFFLSVLLFNRREIDL